MLLFEGLESPTTVFNVTGSEVSSSTEAKDGHRGAGDQSVTEISSSVESHNGNSGQYGTENGFSLELACVFGKFTLEGSDSNTSFEYPGVPTNPYVAPGDGLGDQPGYDFTVIYDLSGYDINGSTEDYTLEKNGFPIVVHYVCKPQVFVFYNPLTESQYNPLSEEDYNLMEE